MMKNYYAREEEAKSQIEKKDLEITASVEVLLDKESPSKDKKLLLEFGTYRKKKSLSNVKLATELNDIQSRQLQGLLNDHDQFFLDVPGRASR